MRREPHQHFAFLQRLAHQPPLPLLQIAQAAVNQLAARHRRRAAQITAFAQGDANARPAASRATPTPLIPPPISQKIILAVQRVHRVDRLRE